MAWTGLVLTVEGRNALNEAQLSGSMRIKAVAVGDGASPANFRTQKGLVHQLYAVTELKIDRTENGCTVTADFPEVEYDYYFREIGILIDTDQGEKLYVYDNCGEDAQYIVSSTGVEKTRKRLRLSLVIADVPEITVANPGILYVAYDDFETAVQEMHESLSDHADNKDNPHHVTKGQVGLGNADNTSDADKPVSTAQQAALDTYYEQLAAYVRQKIADLVGGAPAAMDTLKELADALAAHKSVMDALDAAIGKKANAAEFDSHVKDAVKHITASERTKWNGKADKTGMSGATASAAGASGLVPAPPAGAQGKYLTGGAAYQNVDDHAAVFTGGDALNPTVWTDVPAMQSGETHKSLFGKISTMFRNVRYLWKVMGSADISAIGDGTVTGAIRALNTGMVVMKPIDSMHDITSSTEYVYTGVSVDIPAGACYTLTAIAYYNFGRPVSVGISTSDVNTVHPKASSLEANNSASCTLLGFTFGNMKLYVWASYNNASANTVYLRGFYIIPKT